MYANIHRHYYLEGTTRMARLSGASPLSGKPHTVEVKVEDLNAYDAGALVQNAFPYLSTDDREFLISGLVPGEFDALFGKDE